MAKKKLSSYQKLKIKIAEQSKEIHQLRSAIYHNDEYFLSIVKKQFQMALDLENAMWNGDVNLTPRKPAQGFLALIEKND